MKQSLATRIRVKRIKDIACKYTNANPDIFNVRRRKYMVDTKRLAAWLFWYYSSTASKRIGEYLSVDHSTVFFSVRKLNHLIETDWRIADMVLLAEKEMSSMGMKKQNRIACSMRKESLDFATNYKKENIRPIPTTKKIDQILLLSNDMKIIESILKRKKKEIVLLDNVNDVRVMAREIAEIEKSVKVLC